MMNMRLSRMVMPVLSITANAAYDGIPQRVMVMVRVEDGGHVRRCTVAHKAGVAVFRFAEPGCNRRDKEAHSR